MTPLLQIARRLLDQVLASVPPGGHFGQVTTIISQPMWELYLDGIEALAGKEARHTRTVGGSRIHIITSEKLFAITIANKV